MLLACSFFMAGLGTFVRKDSTCLKVRRRSCSGASSSALATLQGALASRSEVAHGGTRNLLYDSICCVELIKLQTKDVINNLTQGPTPQHRVCSHCELCNVFYRLHLVVGTFSIEFDDEV